MKNLFNIVGQRIVFSLFLYFSVSFTVQAQQLSIFATDVSFGQLGGLTSDGEGNLYVADVSNHKIHKINPNGVVSLFAGTGTMGNQNGKALEASFNGPTAVFMDKKGNLFVSDRKNHKIRVINAEGMVSDYAGTGTKGYLNGEASLAMFDNPTSLAIDTLGNLYVTDIGNIRVRKITAAGMVSTQVVGFAANSRVDNTRFVGDLKGIAIDRSNNLYMADSSRGSLYKQSLGQTLIQQLTFGMGYQDGLLKDAKFKMPNALVIDNEGNLYIADAGNNRIRMLSPEGVVSTYAGSGSAIPATFSGLNGLTFDAQGNMYVAGFRDIVKISKIVTNVEKSLESQASLAIYPNPVQEHLYIKGEVLLQPYKITNALGEKVREGVWQSQQIDLQDLGKGIYFLQTLTLDGQTNVMKFTKQ